MYGKIIHELNIYMYMLKIEYTVGYFIINCKLYIPQAEMLPFAEAYYMPNLWIWYSVHFCRLFIQVDLGPI